MHGPGCDNIAGAVGGKVGGILGDVGGILSGQPAGGNTQTNKVSPLDLLKQFRKKK